MFEKIVKDIRLKAVQCASTQANRHLDLLLEMDRHDQAGNPQGAVMSAVKADRARIRASVGYDVAVHLGGEETRTEIVEKCGGIDIFGNEYGALTAADIVESCGRRKT